MPIQITQAQKEHLLIIKQRAYSLLADNELPFWANNAWDNEYGGFLTRLNQEGKRLEDTKKVLMMQVRMIFSLSAVHRFGLQDRGYLDLAKQGFEFLIRHFWDKNDGGFYFSVDRLGNPLNVRKNTDFHAYAIIGLVEYFHASGCQESLEWAIRVYDLLINEALDHDKGFREDFDNHCWPVLNADQMSLGDQTDIKTVDMHTNMLEAMLYLSTATGFNNHRQTLEYLVQLICSRGIDAVNHCSITAFDQGWNPVTDGRGQSSTSYGLNVELAWLLLKAVRLLEKNEADYHHIITGLVDHALAFGYDHDHGGLYSHGPMNGSVWEVSELFGPLQKPWWSQAELLNALGDLYIWIGHPEYLLKLIEEFNWISQYQVDHVYGSWYQDINGVTFKPVTLDKGGEWKTAFHTSRALIKLIKNLELITEK